MSTLAPTPTRTPLARLQDLLSELEVEVELREPEADGQIEVLDISLGADDQGRPLQVRVFVLAEMLNAIGLPGDDDIALLLLQADLPLTVAAKAKPGDIEASLNLINQFSFIGSFAYYPKQRAIAFKYTLTSPDSNFHGRVVFETLWSMRLFLADLMEPLSQLASGAWDAATFKRHLEDELGLALPADLAPAPRH